ncbi:MAG: DUF3604 domain-containing protein [Hyphomicrobiales bacterium]|nr:DUF3604 domain-containing protein [Hyphomicrobiales bacterium]
MSVFSASAADVEIEKGEIKYSPFAEKDYPQNVYFGDTHHHTANSGDAFMNGNRLNPAQAYRLARGEEVVSSSGVPIKLSRPLDFLVISDHAEGLGVMYEVYNGNPTFMKDETLVRWNKAMKAGGKEAADATNEVVAAQGAGTLPKPITDPKTAGPVMKSVWETYTQTAEEFNNPGKFTAMIGYEWTSVPGGNNLHRNILYRGNKSNADKMMPYNSWASEDPEKLWDWMEKYENKTGGRVLAIPHNGNLSNGRMFEPNKFDGSPIDKDYAERRARWERLQEVMQTKGNSETHPTLSPNDEFANYGIAGWEYGNLTMQDNPESPEMRPYMYLRGGLQQGLSWEKKLGANPFKFGFIGGTDVHNSLTSIEEDNFFGKHVIQEPRPNRWEHVSKQGFGKTRYTWHYSAAGYAAVWARENTRESLWDAMHRKETYATSGSRMTVRFFGGWNYRAEDAENRYLAEAGYAKGVPMGGDLTTPTNGANAPSFLVAAMKDPLGGNLDRIQIIKGWLDTDGKTHEKIYNVTWGNADKRKLGSDGKIPLVGDTVNVAQATWTNTIGDPELSGVWTDPDFDPFQKSFYYARVIEIPTPRWTAYDQKRFGIKMSDDVKMKHQERAWSSPIWYTPNGEFN